MLGNTVMGYDMVLLTELSAVVRILLSTFCGCVLGMERARKLRAAGARTYALVCMGATVTMMTGQFISQFIGATDLARIGAQVVSGIGFIGAGTIIVTGYHKVKGVTTAAGLWAAACMGLAIGAGFYLAGIVACVTILFVITLMDTIEARFVAQSNRLRVFVVLKGAWDMQLMLKHLHDSEMVVDDFEILSVENQCNFGVVFLLKSLRHRPHEEIVKVLEHFDGVIMAEEM